MRRPTSFAPQLRPYLLDTCFVSAALNRGHSNFSVANGFLEENRKSSRPVPVFYSIISIAEIRFGINLLRHRTGEPSPIYEKIITQMNDGSVVGITKAVAEKYAQMRTALAFKFMPKRSAQKGKLGEMHTWVYEFENVDLQVQEGDLWIAAQAQQFHCTIVTFDGGFVRHKSIDHDKLLVHVLTSKGENHIDPKF